MRAGPFLSCTVCCEFPRVVPRSALVSCNDPFLLLSLFPIMRCCLVCSEACEMNEYLRGPYQYLLSGRWRVGGRSSVVKTICAKNYRSQKRTSREPSIYHHMEAQLKHTHSRNGILAEYAQGENAAIQIILKLFTVRKNRINGTRKAGIKT